ncbi:MAG: ATP-dependent Clp protease proteolytic subunit [Verrucomicrobiaceae bacterium]
MFKNTLILTTSIILPLSALAEEQAQPAAPAQNTAEAAQAAPAKEASPEEKPKAQDDELEALTRANSLEAEKQKQETNELRAQIARLKLEKELFREQLEARAMQKGAENADELVKFEAEKARLTRDSELSKLALESASNELKQLQTEASLGSIELEAEIREIETKKKRDAYADAEPQYLDDPLKPDGTLVISDRRIPFNGPVTSSLANAVTTKINYFNNKDPKKPIFIVIDDSPGGSVMAGYRILKAMEGSQAPVYVVVKSFAASMAACITTLAEKSYAYPNAIILHHQISSTYFFSSLNLTDHKEAYEDMKRWWARLADPISEKMGITSDEFIEQMYEKTKSGDWTEFGDEAQKLKWVDTIVQRIHETSLLVDPDAVRKTPERKTTGYATDITPGADENGVPVMYLPRRNPKDVYFMYNPDGYYRFK